MDLQLNLARLAVAFAAILFVAMLAAFEVGRRIGQARLARDSSGLAKGVGTAEGAVFALLGLIIAFTFAGAASRFEERRHLVTEEANAIGTAYLRLDLLPAASQPPLRDLFRRYTELRAVVYQDAPNRTLTQDRLDQTAALQLEIWNASLAAARLPEAGPTAAMLLLPALNQMIDITTTRVAATRNHPPLVVWLLLSGLSLLGALLVGYEASENKKRAWLHMVGFAAVMALAVYVIVELEFPRLGLIQVGGIDLLLHELRQSMR